MKKCILILLLVALLSALVLPGYAAQDELFVDNITVKPGETVYVKLKLTQSTKGDAVGVSYSYDPAVLKPLESSSSWANQGLLQDFDAKKSAGVWAVEDAVELKGLVCTLAFEVVSKEEHFDTKVSCTLTVKKDSKDVGSFTADAAVSSHCDHEYGKWQDKSTLGHTRECVHCGRKQTQSHHWDDGTTKPVAGKPDMAVTVYTCEDCGATREFEHISTQKPTVPEETEPEETRPTEPDDPHYPTEEDAPRPTYPDHSDTDRPDPTQPENDQHTHPTLPGFSGEFPDTTFPGFDEDHDIPTYPDHGHDHETAPTEKEEHDHNHTTEAPQDEHDHDHTVTPAVDSKTKNRNGWIVLGILVVLCGGAYFYVRKKR